MILSCWLNNSSDWFFAVVGALMGTLLGIGFTELSRFFIRKSNKKSALNNLYSNLSNIRKLIDQTEEQLTEKLKSDGVPDFQLDLSSLVNRITKSEAYLSVELWSRLDGLRFQIEHFNNKLAILVYIVTSHGSERLEGHPALASVLKHVKELKKWIYEAISAIETEKEEA